MYLIITMGEAFTLVIKNKNLNYVSWVLRDGLTLAFKGVALEDGKKIRDKLSQVKPTITNNLKKSAKLTKFIFFLQRQTKQQSIDFMGI